MTDFRWHVVGPPHTLREPEAILALRLGMAANALTSSLNMTRLVAETPESPVKQLLMLQLLQLAASYLKEATVLMSKHWAEIEAVAGSVHEVANDVDRCRRLAHSTDPLCPMLQRVRSRLTFHWDPREARKWIRSYSDEAVIWSQGVGDRRQGLIHRASSGVVAGRLLGSPPGESKEETERKLLEVLPNLLSAIDSVHRVIDVFVGEFIDSHGFEFKEGDPPTTDDTSGQKASGR